jgi:hypothetical protein
VKILCEPTFRVNVSPPSAVAIRSPEMSVRTRSTQRRIQEDGILHSHRREYSKLTYCFYTGRLLFEIWRYILPKRRFTLDVHGATFKKTAYFIVTDVETQNLHIVSIWGGYFSKIRDTFLRNVGSRKSYTAPHPSRRHSS